MDIIFNGDSHVIEVSDESYRYKEIKSGNELILKFSLAEFLEIPLGAYCVFEGETYTLKALGNLKMVNSENYEYTVTFKSAQANLTQYKFRNTVDRRLSFNLTAKPQEHLQMLVDNLNNRESGWAVGDYVDLTETLVSYDHTSCFDALNLIADAFKTEWEIVGKTISLKKVEYNKDAPLVLGYGKGNGFVSGTSRTNISEKPPIEVLFTQGSDTNLDTTAYGAPELLLPKFQALNYDGTYFEGETGYDATSTKAYITDLDGYSVKRSDKTLETNTEDSIDLSNIFPQRVGTISAVQDIDVDKNWYNIVDNSIPDSLDYDDCLIAGETMTIIFQSGMLAGREFEVNYSHDGGLIESSNFTVPLSVRTPRRFEIVPAELDGVWMPSETFKPVVGDTYIVYHIMMPDAYIRDDTTKTGASWDMYREAVKYLSDNEDNEFTFTGTLDTIWSKNNWLTYGGKFILGGYVFFSNDDWLSEGINVRITGLKTYVNKPYAPELTLSNATVGSSFSSNLISIENKEVVIDNNKKESTLFTKRRYSDVKTTMEMLNSALLTNFTESVNPITVQTMSLLVGDDALQFRFVDNMTSPTEVTHSVNYDNETQILTADAGIIQHMTLGITTLTSSHDVSEYKFWSVAEYTSPALSDSDVSYYIYLKANKVYSSNCRFLLSETAIAMDDGLDCYYLLVGILNAEFDGERSYASMYGFTEISPAGITANRIATGDGLSYIDFLSNKLHLGNDTSYLDWNNLQADTLSTTNLSLLNCSIKDSLKVDGTATLANFNFSNDKIESVLSEELGSSLVLNGADGTISSFYAPDGSTSSNQKNITLGNGSLYIQNFDTIPKGIICDSDGLYSDNPQTATDENTIASHLGSIVGVGESDMNVNSSLPSSDYNYSAGVIGRMTRNGTAPAYGGYFDNLFANGLLLSTRYVNEDTGPNPTEDSSLYKILSNSNTFVFSLGNIANVITFILPPYSPQVGQTVFFKNAGTKGLRIGTAKYHSIYVDHTSVIDVTISAGKGAIATLVYINSTNTDYRWSVIEM